jgi:hypothetical protein
MTIKLGLILILLAALAFGAFIFSRGADGSKATATPSQGRAARGLTGAAVLVELFTSEGCSSCPPADEVLTRLEEDQPVPGVEVVALGHHVDYWDRLGWRDPFSSADFSRRQSEYAAAFGRNDVYTPQMVVDGRIEFVGSNLARAREAIETAAANPKAGVRIRLLDAGTKEGELPLAINVENLPEASATDVAEVWLAVTESGLKSSVSRGENTGRKLSHSAVTRRLERIGEIEPGKSAFEAKRVARVEKDWKSGDLRIVVFVQERASRRVIGAASLRLER